VFLKVWRDSLVRIDRAGSMPVSPRTALLTLYAATNIAVGIGLALTQPSRAGDLWTIYEWCRAWLLHGQQLYAGPYATTDYPPNAVVLFAPLALLPKQWLVPVWAAVTLSITPLLACVVIRSVRPRIQLADALLPMLLFFCWGGVRTLLEFSRLCMMLAFLAVFKADSRPVSSGVSLGLALAKPHIAGPIMLWALFTRRARVVAVAMAVVAAGFAAYCVRAQVTPTAVMNDYGRILLSLYSGADGLIGRTSLRPWWIALAGQESLGDILWGIGAGLLLIVPCGIAMRGSDVSDVRAAAPALFCLWSLLTIYHIGNNLILMFPAFAFLLLVDDAATLWWRVSLASAIQLAMMLDVPVHLASSVRDRGPVFLVVRDFDRLVVLVTFISVTILWRRLERARVAPTILA